MAGVRRHKMNSFFLKVRGSSLVETLVATVIIMLVFGIAMFSITNILERTVKHSTSYIDSQLQKLIYQFHNDLLQVPDVIEQGDWEIEVKRVEEGEIRTISLKAIHKKTKKVREKKIVE